MTKFYAIAVLLFLGSVVSAQIPNWVGGPRQEGGWHEQGAPELKGDVNVNTADANNDTAGDCTGSDGNTAWKGTLHSDGSVTLTYSGGLYPDVTHITFEVVTNADFRKDVLKIHQWNGTTLVTTQVYDRVFADG